MMTYNATEQKADSKHTALPQAASQEQADTTPPAAQAFQDLPDRCHPGWVHSGLAKGTGSESKRAKNIPALG